MASYDILIGEFGLDDVQEIGEDIFESRYAFIAASVSCLVVMFIYALMIYYMAGVLVWFSIIATGVGVLLLSLGLNEWV